MKNTGRILIIGVWAMLLAGCSPSEPIRLGFLAGLSGSASDLGEAGQAGAILAVDETNANGGIHGRKIELLVSDDAQKPEVAVLALRTLAADGAVVVIGPMTSAMAQAVLPESQKIGLILVSPTVTGSSLFGRDDNFFTTVSSTALYAGHTARHQFALGHKRIAALYDSRNSAFTQDWIEGYRRTSEALGGRVVRVEPFTSGKYETYAPSIDKLKGAKVDAIMYVANALDTVRLMQLARLQGLQLPAIGVPWSATEELLELGGRSVEGLTSVQMINRDDPSPRFQAFRDAFMRRYRKEPGFASVKTYEATQAAIEALRRQRADQSLKAALLQAGPFEGLQDRWSFDRHGDAQRKSYIAVIRNGRFVNLD